jgi:hypothetical protein
LLGRGGCVILSATKDLVRDGNRQAEMFRCVQHDHRADSPRLKPNWRSCLLALLIFSCSTHLARAADDADDANTPAEPAQPPERVYTPAEIARDMGAPTTLTLHLNGVDTRTLFDAVTAQSGIRFGFPDEANRPVSAQCDGQPFWVEMGSILRDSGYNMEYYLGDAGTEIYSLNSNANRESVANFLSGPTVAAGPFVLELQGAYLFNGRFLSLEQRDPANPPPGGPHSVAEVQIGAKLFCDPKIAIFDVWPSVKTAIDDTGQSLAGGRDASAGNELKPQIGQFSLPLKYPAKTAKVIKSLEGSIRLRAIVRSQEWQIPDPLKAGAVTKTFGIADQNVTITLKTTKHEVERGTYTIAVTASGKSRSVFKTVESMLAGARWIDLRGQPIDFNSAGSHGEGGDESATYQINYRPAHPDDPVAEPITLVLTVPTDIRTVEIPFSFHDLPLP